MNASYALLTSTMAGLSTLLGGIVIFFKIKEKYISKFITFCLAFSIMIMIGISITDLIPTSFFRILFSYNKFVSILIISISFLMGVLLIFILNKYMNKHTDSLYKLGLLSMLALIVHNFPEGIATFISSISEKELGLKLAIAIMFHNIPEGISIAVPIYYASKKKSKALLFTLISSLAEPLGAILSYLFLKDYITPEMISITLLFVAGIMITLSIQEMLPSALKYKENKYLYLGFFSSLIILLVNHLLF